MIHLLGNQFIKLSQNDKTLLEPFIPDPETIILKKHNSEFIIKMYNNEFPIALNDKAHPYHFDVIPLSTFL